MSRAGASGVLAQVHPPGAIANTTSCVKDLNPRKQGEQEEEDHSTQLPTGQHLLGFLSKLKIN